MSLEVKKLAVSVGDKEIFSNLSLEVKPGEVHAIMGPNGSGKSTLANAIAGHPKYTITSGKILVDGEQVQNLSPDKRAQRGVFLSMQYVPEIPGVSVTNFLRTAKAAITGEKQHPIEFHKYLVKKMEILGLDKKFARRALNVGFSGGEKKKLEALQLSVLDPKYALLDETDSGLDVDALKSVCDGINAFMNKHKGILIITHYNRILEYLKPDVVHIMIDGRIVQSGGAELAVQIEKNGYEAII
ncbi:Fe-S cluster assembly ATPase SufC [Candidatus Nomurabacteria bacterium]|nr:Fe-S cluster assembly ATPase SufC [Candidatus Nomurabacteria bacterium]